MLAFFSVRSQYFAKIDGATPFLQEGAVERVLPVRARDTWEWEEWQMWLLPVAAVVLPAMIHRWQLGRCAPSYQVARSLEPGGGYRGAPFLTVSISPNIARRRIATYSLRLGLATALCYIPVIRLIEARFIENWGCVGYAVRSVPEYTFEATLILVALLFHAPTPRRLLGVNPLANKPLQRTGAVAR